MRGELRSGCSTMFVCGFNMNIHGAFSRSVRGMKVFRSRMGAIVPIRAQPDPAGRTGSPPGSHVPPLGSISLSLGSCLYIHFIWRVKYQHATQELGYLRRGLDGFNALFPIIYCRIFNIVFTNSDETVLAFEFRYLTFYYTVNHGYGLLYGFKCLIDKCGGCFRHITSSSYMVKKIHYFRLGENTFRQFFP